MREQNSRIMEVLPYPKNKHRGPRQRKTRKEYQFSEKTKYSHEDCIRPWGPMKGKKSIIR
jgi:hypothetical protein